MEIIVCLICKSALEKESICNAIEYGLDTNGTVTIYSCSNNSCKLIYELIELDEPPAEDSEDFYIYGKQYLKFYK